MYVIPSKAHEILRNSIGKKIIRMTSVNSKYNESYILSVKESYRFSFRAFRFYISIEKYGTLAFAYLGTRYRSMGVTYLLKFPTHSEMSEDMRSDSQIFLYEADSEIYSSQHFSNFLNTHIVKIEIIDAHEWGIKYENNNERGIKITNEFGNDIIVGYNVQEKQYPIGTAIITHNEMRKDGDLFTLRDIS